MLEHILEAAREPIVIPVAVGIYARVAEEPTPDIALRRRSVSTSDPALLTITERVLTFCATTLARNAAAAQIELARRVRATAEGELPPWFNLDRDTSRLISVNPFPLRSRPFLFDAVGRIDGPFELAFVRSLGDAFDTSITVSIQDILLERGSWWLKTQIAISSAAAGLLGIAVGLVADDVWEEHKMQHQFVEIVDGQLCEATLQSKVDVKNLENVSETLLNYEETGISVEQRELRVCSVQALLAAHHLSPGEIDGKLGPKTNAALEVFRKTHHLDGHAISSPTFRSKLLDVPKVD